MFCLQGIPKYTGFLEGVLNWLQNAVHQYEDFPVMDWNTFLHAIRSNVNPLAGEEHVKELCFQLQTMGEVRSDFKYQFKMRVMFCYQ